MEDSIINDVSAKQFQLKVEGFVACIDYELESNVLILAHTRVPKELEGKGVGSRLAKGALEYADQHSLRVVPECPFVASYIERHQEYRSLVFEK